MSNICPKGHFSTDIDYCSECGAPISASRKSDAPAAPTTTGSSALASCPDCMTPRRPDARFCEVCRYDFESAKSFSGLQNSLPPTITAMPSEPAVTPSPVAVLAPAATVAAAVSITPVAAAVSVQRLKLTLLVDPSLYVDPDPATPCPEGVPAKEYHLDLEENTLGRQFEGKGIHPEIVVQDPGVSRRHLKFMRDSSGNFNVLELGSANGTELNQAVLEAGVVTPVHVGDQFTLGMWTRIVVEARN